MNLPGFTAEFDLYRGDRHYVTGFPGFRGSHKSGETAGVNSVLPSLAIYVDGRYVCNGEVTDNGFINCDPIGGGGGPGRDPICRPSCGPCRAVPGQGRMKTCILRNCDDVERRC